MRSNRRGELSVEAFLTIVLLLGVLLFVPSCMYIKPKYDAWSKELSAAAELKAAEYTKRITIETAKAEVESAKLRAQAIEIVGESTKKYPEYRTQEFIGAFADAMANGAIQKIIYVPTEANIPIIEAKGN